MAEYEAQGDGWTYTEASVPIGDDHPIVQATAEGDFQTVCGLLLIRLPLLRTPRLEGDIFSGAARPTRLVAVVSGLARTRGLDADARKSARRLAMR